MGLTGRDANVVFLYNPLGQTTEEFLNLPVHLGYLGTFYVKCCVTT